MRIVPQGERPTIMTHLHQSPLFHRMVKTLRVQQMARFVLSQRPIVRKIKESQLVYRLQHLESFLLADEIFGRKVYRSAFADQQIETFIDLGSNVGFFFCYVAAQSKGKPILGLAVDGSKEMAAESEWHASANKLNVKVMHGAAGFPESVNEVTFYVNPSNVASSAQPNLNPNVPAKGESQAVTVPAVHVYKEWRKLAGDKRVNLLKIDIEGTECDLIREEQALLAITDRIVIEWHNWVTSLDEVSKLLSDAGFELVSVVGEDENTGVGVFARK